MEFGTGLLTRRRRSYDFAPPPISADAGHMSCRTWQFIVTASYARETDDVRAGTCLVIPTGAPLRYDLDNKLAPLIRGGVYL